MENHYKLLLTAIVTEFIMLLAFDIKIQSKIGNLIAAFIFFLPIQILLFLLGKDQKISKKKRIVCRIIFWYINICYLITTVVMIAGFI